MPPMYDGRDVFIYVPRKDRASIGRRMNLIPKSRVWELRMPTVLGGVGGHRRLLRALRREQSVAPAFFSSDLEVHRKDPAFDLARYARLTAIHQARVTRRWGWNRRDTTDTHTTEFFQWANRATAAWALAVLREHIVAELNALMRRLGIEARIVITGLVYPQEAIRIREALIRGDMSFEDAHKKLDVLM